jgi:hypothetical protein
MCKAPKPPKPKEPDKPEFMRNRYLDGAMGMSNAVNSLRAGRSEFRIPLASTAGAAPTGIETTPSTTGVANPVAPTVVPTVGPIAARRGGRNNPEYNLR